MGVYMRQRRRLDATRCLLIAGTVTAALLGPGCETSPRTTAATSLASYAFWPQPPAEPRIQFLRAFARSTDVSGEQQSGLDKLIFGAEEDRAVPINKPYGVTMHAGRIYVCDIRNTGVAVLDLRKRQARLMGVSGFNRLQNPVDVAAAPDGMIYVADKMRGIMVYDRAERYTGVFGHADFQPIGVAVHGDRLYVCNMASQIVEIMDRRDGSLLGTIGSIGDEDGQFRLPLGIDVDLHGNIHVTDVMRCRLQKFSPGGELLAAVGFMTDTAGNFVRPKHVAVDREGLVYVVDAAFQNVQVFDPQYRLLTSFGAAGSHPGAMNLPAGICVMDEDLDLFHDDVHPFFDPLRLILVTNQFGPSKVSVYAMGQLKAGRVPADLAPVLAPIPPGDRPSDQPDPLSGLDAQPLTDSPPVAEPDEPPQDQE
jgi:hypothetical protein